MSRAQKIVLGVAGGTLVLLAGLTVAAGAAVYEAGSVAVRVQEKHGDRNTVRFQIPAVLLHAGLMVVPEVKWRQARLESGPELRQWWPVIESTLGGLARCPDGLLILVDSADENVRIAKEGRTLVVDVETPDESVHVSIPLGVVTSVVRRLAPTA
jgi:hypothetical protein